MKIQISQKLFDEILSTLKDEREHWKQKWFDVGNHPASRHRREFRHYRELISRIENELGLPQGEDR